MTEPHSRVREPKSGIDGSSGGRNCEGEAGFLGRDRGVMDMREEGSTIDVAVPAAIYRVNFLRKNSVGRSCYLHILDA